LLAEPLMRRVLCRKGNRQNRVRLCWISRFGCRGIRFNLGLTLHLFTLRLTLTLTLSHKWERGSLWKTNFSKDFLPQRDPLSHLWERVRVRVRGWKTSKFSIKREKQTP